MVLDQDEVYQEIDGEMRHHQDTACFLGFNLDLDIKWKTYSENLLTRLKQRIGLFSAITGSVNFPRADSNTSLLILKTMIVRTHCILCPISHLWKTKEIL